MTNQLALYLGALILIAFGIDWIRFDWEYSFFLARKFVEFIEWLKFWR